MINQRQAAALVIAACAVVGAACGGSETGTDTGTDPAPAATPTATEPPATDSVTGDSTGDSTDPVDAPTTDATPDTDGAGTPPPTEVEPPRPEPFDLAQIPTVIASMESAFSDPGIAPLDIAEAIGGFPLPIPMPDGSTLYDITTRFGVAEQGTLETSFTYVSVGPGGTVPDVDIQLDGNGPGSAQIIDVFDPIMTGLGFDRANSTASDPGDPGGPNSVNHVYVPTSPIGTFNGVDGSVGNVFVWADEDVNGGSYRDETPLGGYLIDLEIDTVADGSVPVPLLDALLERFPVSDGMTLTRGELRIQRRPPDSFDADRGLASVAITLEWNAPTDAMDALVAYYADPAVFGDPWRAAEASFFNEGEYEPAEMYQYGDADQRLSLLLLDRYEGLLGIDAPDEPGGPVLVRLDLSLDTIAPVLLPPSD